MSERSDTQTLPVDPHGPTKASGPGALSADLPAGTTLHRYVLEEAIGRGGMGVVYRAHDPHLDRDVALKLLPKELGDSAADADRMLKEAQTLARLSHPNVVTVFDVGIERGQIFLVMELIRGVTLKEWLAKEKRSLRDIRRVFAAAGQGLYAAHQAGIVHRDFKPQNVLCAESGRVCVSDFGIAVLGEEEQMLVAGTPAYMAPEQQTGGKIAASADQYSFCVALEEALSGRRIPPRLERMIRRGRAPNPVDRHPSMAKVLATLEGRRERLIIGGGALVVAAGVAFFAGSLQAQPNAAEVCARGAQRMAERWNPQTSGELRAALATRGPWDLAYRVTRSLDGYAHAWQLQYEQACQATHEHGTQSADTLRRRLTCLDRRRREMETVVQLISKGEAQLGSALQAASSLEPLQSCTDDLRLVALPALPEDRRRLVDTLEDQVARAHALYMIGDFDDATKLAEDSLAAARKVGYPPILADALITMGAIHLRLGNSARAADHWYEASLVAEDARLDRTVADARAWLIYVVGVDLGRTQEALRIAQGARAALDRIGGDDAIEARYYDHLASVYAEGLGKTREGLRLYEQSVPLNRRAFGQDHLKVALTFYNMGVAYRRIGELDASRRALEEAIAMTDRVLGDSSYQTTMLIDLAITEGDAKRFDAAARHVKRAQELLQKVPDSPVYLAGDLDRARVEVALAAGDIPAALAAARRSVASYREHGLERSPWGYQNMMTLGRVLLAAKDLRAAEEQFKECKELAEELWGVDSPWVLSAELNLVDVTIQRGLAGH